MEYEAFERLLLEGVSIDNSIDDMLIKQTVRDIYESANDGRDLSDNTAGLIRTAFNGGYQVAVLIERTANLKANLARVKLEQYIK